MRTVSASPFRSRIVATGALAIAGALAGALAACDRRAPRESQPGTSRSDSVAIVSESGAVPRVAVATAPTGSPQEPDRSELFVRLEPVANASPVADLLVAEPRGGRLGVEPGTFRTVRENTRAWYDSSPANLVTDDDEDAGPLVYEYALVTPAAGEYTVDVVGRRAEGGAYALVVRVIMPGGEMRAVSVRGSRIRAGEVHRYVFGYDRSGNAPLSVTRR